MSIFLPVRQTAKGRGHMSSRFAAAYGRLLVRGNAVVRNILVSGAGYGSDILKEFLSPANRKSFDVANERVAEFVWVIYNMAASFTHREVAARNVVEILRDRQAPFETRAWSTVAALTVLDDPRVVLTLVGLAEDWREPPVMRFNAVLCLSAVTHAGKQDAIRCLVRIVTRFDSELVSHLGMNLRVWACLWIMLEEEDRSVLYQIAMHPFFPERGVYGHWTLAVVNLYQEGKPLYGENKDYIEAATELARQGGRDPEIRVAALNILKYLYTFEKKKNSPLADGIPATLVSISQNESAPLMVRTKAQALARDLGAIVPKHGR